jgi:hypothetical protein
MRANEGISHESPRLGSAKFRWHNKFEIHDCFAEDVPLTNVCCNSHYSVFTSSVLAISMLKETSASRRFVWCTSRHVAMCLCLSAAGIPCFLFSQNRRLRCGLLWLWPYGADVHVCSKRNRDPVPEYPEYPRGAYRLLTAARVCYALLGPPLIRHQFMHIMNPWNSPLHTTHHRRDLTP